MKLLTIQSDKDTQRIVRVLWCLTIVLLLAGGVLELTILPGALVAASGIVVAVTAPIFASVLGQIAEFGAAARLNLFNIRKELKVGNAWLPSTWSVQEREKVEAGIAEAKVLEEKHLALDQSVRRENDRLIRTQTWIVAISALLAALGGYLTNFLECGNLTC